MKINIVTLWKIWRFIKKHILKKQEKQFSFGKQVPQRDYRTLRMSKYSVNLPQPPVSFDNLTRIFAYPGMTTDVTVLFPMDGNNAHGDCTIAGIAHATTVYDGLVGNEKIPSEDEVLKTYFKLTCGRDSGLNELKVLKYWKNKGFSGEKILAFVAINPKNHVRVKQAIQLFGGVYLGFQVQENCLNDFLNRPWTPGKLLNEGHAVYAPSYDENYVSVLTWGNIQKGTWAWWDACVDEAYVILPLDAEKPGFAPGFDFAQLKADLEELSQ